MAKLFDCMKQVGFGEVIPLKVNSGVAVDLKIEQRRADPVGLAGRFFGGGDFGEAALLPLGQNRLAVEDVPGVDFAVYHGGVISRELR